jgi:hypothetical protein
LHKCGGSKGSTARLLEKIMRQTIQRHDDQLRSLLQKFIIYNWVMQSFFVQSQKNDDHFQASHLTYPARLLEKFMRHEQSRDMKEYLTKIHNL